MSVCLCVCMIEYLVKLVVSTTCTTRESMCPPSPPCPRSSPCAKPTSSPPQPQKEQFLKSAKKWGRHKLLLHSHPVSSEGTSPESLGIGRCSRLDPRGISGHLLINFKDVVMIGCHMLMRCDDESIKTQQIEVKIYPRLMINWFKVVS